MSERTKRNERVSFNTTKKFKQKLEEVAEEHGMKKAEVARRGAVNEVRKLNGSR